MPYKDKEDQARYAREHRERNRQKYREANKRSTKKRKDAVRHFVADYLRRNPCVDCGEPDIVVLEFDHRDPSQKKLTLGVAVTNGDHSIEAIMAEIEKCDVRCANCHRRKTARERGYFRHLISADLQEERPVS